MTDQERAQPNVADLLMQVQDKELADYAEAVAKMYEPVEQIYALSLGPPVASLLAASTNHRPY